MENIRNRLDRKNKNAAEGARILAEIPLKPALSDSFFWKQTQQDFIASNPHFFWQEENREASTNRLSARFPENIKLWTICPVELSADFKDSRLISITINLWNKGDSSCSEAKDVFPAYKKLKSRLEESGFVKTETKQKISSHVKRKWETYTIGQTDISFSYLKKEYFFVRISPFAREKERSEKIANQFDRENFRHLLLSHVRKQADGDVFIADIPMVDQGEKGYCAPAACARVLLYYGFQVDMHILAELMKTRGSGGTPVGDLETSLRKTCQGNPLSFKELHFFRFNKVKNHIDKGIPIIWLIPRHLTLIIGYNEKTDEIIYSDSWGKAGEKKKMPFLKAKSLTKAFYILK